MKNRLFNIKELYRKLFTNLRSKYKVVVMDESFHEKVDVRLSRMQVLGFLSMLVLLAIVFTTCMILFTPLKNLVPGHTKEEFIEQVYENRMQLDSLQYVMDGQKLMLQLLQASVKGEYKIEEAENIKDSLKDYSNIAYTRSVADSLLRKEIEEGSSYQITSMTSNSEDNSFAERFLFFTPVNGKCVRKYDPILENGIEISCQPNEAIKAVLDGYVVFTDWSPEKGYVLVIQHEDRLLSVYSLNSALLKRRGDFVRAGEGVAMAGERLHFELWYNGFSMNPQNYLTF